MTVWPLQAVFFCLGTGAALGLFYLICKVLRLWLGAGPLLTAFFDVFFCLICGAAVFLCALAMDKGRLRLFQAGLQALGGWGAYTALDPLASRLGRLGRKGRSGRPRRRRGRSGPGPRPGPEPGVSSGNACRSGPRAR